MVPLAYFLAVFQYLRPPVTIPSRMSSLSSIRMPKTCVPTFRHHHRSIPLIQPMHRHISPIPRSINRPPILPRHNTVPIPNLPPLAVCRIRPLQLILRTQLLPLRTKISMLHFLLRLRLALRNSRRPIIHNLIINHHKIQSRLLHGNSTQ